MSRGAPNGNVTPLSDWLATSFKTNNNGVLYITHYIVSCARITLHPFQSKPECIITYNTSATSCPRVPSSKLSGIIALSTQWRRYYSIIFTWKKKWNFSVIGLYFGNRTLFRRGLYFDTASKYGPSRNIVHLADPISTISNRMFFYRLMLT